MTPASIDADFDLCALTAPVVSVPERHPELVSSININQGDYVDGVASPNSGTVALGRAGAGAKAYSWDTTTVHIVKVEVYVTYGFVNSLVFTDSNGNVKGSLGSVTKWAGLVSNITTFYAPEGYGMVGYTGTSRLNLDPYYGIVLVDWFVPLWAPVLLEKERDSLPPLCRTSAGAPKCSGTVPATGSTRNPALISGTVLVFKADVVYGFVLGKMKSFGFYSGLIDEYDFENTDIITSVDVGYNGEYLGGLAFTTDSGVTKGNVSTLVDVTTYKAPRGYGLAGYQATSGFLRGVSTVDSFMPLWGLINLPLPATNPSKPPVMNFPCQTSKSVENGASAKASTASSLMLGLTALIALVFIL